MARDIVCDKLVNEEEASEQRLMKNHRGRTYYFCSKACMVEFERDPDRYGEEKPGFYSGHDAVQTPPPAHRA
jgi:YHS domain-containing protein